MSFLTKKVGEGVTNTRDLKLIRSKNSVIVKELRRSKREAAFNLNRPGLVLPTVQPTGVKTRKKAETEALTDRLQVYRAFKKQKMEEEKKTKKPPFNNFVVTRHTGTTPFRDISNPKCLPRRAHFQPPKSLFPRENINPSQPGPSGMNKDNKNVPTNRKQPTTSTIKKTNGPQKKVPIPTQPETKENKSRKIVAINKELVPKQNNKVAKQAISKGEERRKNIVNATNSNIKNTAARRQPLKGPTASSSVSDVQKNQRALRLLERQKRTAYGASQAIFLKKAQPERSVSSSKVASTSSNPSLTLGSLDPAVASSEQPSTSPCEQPSTSQQPSTSSVQPSSLSSQCIPDSRLTLQLQVITEIPDPEVDPLLPNDLRTGVIFNRTRLQNETDRLKKEVEKWTEIQQLSLPDNINDEILAVTGQTNLLISKKFQQFKGLIDKCESCRTDTHKVTLEDLNGFWEMMYQQVDQLDRRYGALCDLQKNNWKEKNSTCSKKTVKKPSVNQKKTFNGTSKFREFLKAKKSGVQMPETEVPKTPVKNQDSPPMSLYMSASQGEEFNSRLPDVLRTPSTRRTPIVERVLSASRRRSSLALLTLRHSAAMRKDSFAGVGLFP